MVWRREDPQGNEAGKILWELPRYTRGRGLDVGCGGAKAFPHFIGVDNFTDTKLFGTVMTPDLNLDADNLFMLADQSCDFVFSSHCLEHLQDTEKVLREWWRVLKVGGHLVLYLPHKNFYPNIGQEGGNPDHKHDFLPQDIIDIMLKIGPWDLRRNEDRNEGQEYSFFQVFQRLPKGGGHKFSHQDPKPPKTCAVVRYGAWGDALQMSSVLGPLKAQGYHITLYTTPRAWEVVKYDPRIDASYIQDADQVPNAALSDFWANEKGKYNKWVNLSESVEGTVLALADRPSWHSRPQSVRAKYLGRINYIEFQHDIAEVPYTRPEIKFYTSLQEKMWAAEQKKKIGGKPLIMWALNGSSVHKVWPHIDPIFARIFTTYPDARIVTVGDQKSRMLDEPWEKEKRVIRTAGDWSIRQALAFSEICDLVIGPETGILSGASMQPMPKIVFLSHSSHENLTRDWLNTYALFSTKTKCYPCNQMHYSWEHCNRNNDEGVYWSGTAQCQVDIGPDQCWTAIVDALTPKEKIREIRSARV